MRRSCSSMYTGARAGVQTRRPAGAIARPDAFGNCPTFAKNSNRPPHHRGRFFYEGGASLSETRAVAHFHEQRATGVGATSGRRTSNAQTAITALAATANAPVAPATATSGPATNEPAAIPPIETGSASP